jgi:hypothetical protein
VSGSPIPAPPPPGVGRRVENDRPPSATRLLTIGELRSAAFKTLC